MESVVFPWQTKTATSKIGETGDKPRIISEIRKINCLSKLRSTFWSSSPEDFPKPKISGKIFWMSSAEREPRSAEVRQGSLFVFGTGSSGIEFRVPLRRLDLQPCNAPRTFRLSRGSSAPPLVFQALTDEEYEKWVKTLAVELIRQTPLQDVRFLDIISITRRSDTAEKTGKRGPRKEECLIPFRRARNIASPELENKEFNPQETERKRRWETPGKCDKEEREKAEETSKSDSKSSKIRKSHKTTRPVLPFFSKSYFSRWKEEPPSEESGIGSGDENVDNFAFVSVREKKKFFESLNYGKEDESAATKTEDPSEEKLLPVKEIRRLFESREHVEKEQQPPRDLTSAALLNRRRLQRGERKLTKLRIQIAEVEDTVETISQDLRTVVRDFSGREEGQDVVAALQRRLQEENSRLQRLHEETTRVIKENQRTLKKLEREGSD